MTQRQRLLGEAAAVFHVRMIDDVGKNDGNLRLACGGADAECRRKRVVDAGVEFALRLEIGLHEIDEDQCRPLPVADAIGVGAAVIGGEIAAFGALAVYGHLLAATSSNFVHWPSLISMM